jgi:3-isopropylmalate/(R)-2-methylmalate dehydratase small subunit
VISVEAFSTQTGHAVCLRRENIDTDQIVPARFCKRITKSGFADALFAEWRAEDNFVLNEPRHAGACFLIAGRNFGIGSSREHAVWALRDYGFRAVISTGFGEIFRGNALANGLLPISLDAETVGRLSGLAEDEEGMELTVDLAAQVVRHRSVAWRFEFDLRARSMIMAGLDEIALTRERCTGLDVYEAARPRWLPTVRRRDAADRPSNPAEPRPLPMIGVSRPGTSLGK